MKKKITLHSGFLFMALIAITAQCCNTAAPKANEASEAGMQVAANEESAIEVYYFHATRRCATCSTVEENARTHPDRLKDKLIETIAAL